MTSSLLQRFTVVRREVVVALPFGLTVLPACLASGLLAFSPLGLDYAGIAIKFGLYTIIFGCTVTALLARSSFIIYSPRSNLALMQASAVIHLIAHPGLAHHPELVLVAMAACTFLAGLFIILFSACHLTRLIKYTPFPVMAGFINGVAIAVAWSQIKPYFHIQLGPGFLPSVSVENLQMLGFLMFLVIFMFGLARMSRKLPVPIVGLILGIAIYYAFAKWAPEIGLGGMIGDLSVTVLPISPFVQLSTATAFHAVLQFWSSILFISFAIAVIATFESLLVYRAAQTSSGMALGCNRDLIALGVGHCVSAAVGGIAFSAASGQTLSAYREGGRTRLVPVTVGLAILGLLAGASSYLAAIPVVIVSAILVQNAFQRIDKWSIQSFILVVKSQASPERRRLILDLSVVALVMGITVTISVLPAVFAGIVLACLIFIIDMSRPILKRSYSGKAALSKRKRSEKSEEFLEQNGDRRLIAELDGVLFFGNADDLSVFVSGALAHADMVVLDCRGVNDVDATGVSILRDLFKKSRNQKKHILFCNIRPSLRKTMENLVSGQENSIFPDLDSALEYMEEISLQELPDVHEETILLQDHDFIRGLTGEELEEIKGLLVGKEFPAGERLCREGEAADCMWLLMRGSVSIRLFKPTEGLGRRIASCAPGTTVGEMAFIEGRARSADAIADDDVFCYEIGRAAFVEFSSQHPGITTKFLENFARDLSRRLRNTSEDLRSISYW